MLTRLLRKHVRGHMLICTGKLQKTHEPAPGRCLVPCGYLLSLLAGGGVVVVVFVFDPLMALK
jgi:hypothetical protein